METWMPDKIELAWAAGLFDGEGSACVTEDNRTQKTYLSLQVSVSQNDPEVLERFRQAVGTGSVLGPYAYEGRPETKPQWFYRAYGPKGKLVLGLLWPYLSPVKKSQADEAFNRLGG